MSTQPKAFLSEEQYLEMERKAEYKSEYFRGGMFAMAGASLTHNRLTVQAIVMLNRALQAGSCEVFSSDMRVRVPKSLLYTYPDVVVVCGEPEFLDKELDTLLNPILIVEVLSPSTEAYDRGRKFEHYRSIPSLTEYILIATDRVQVDQFARQSDGRWLLTSAGAMEESLDLMSGRCKLALAELYDKIEFKN